MSVIVSCFAFLTATLIVVNYILKRRKNGPKLPPGPMGFPLIGNMLQLGKNPHLKMMKLAQTYGPVYRLQLGSRLVIVVNGMDAIKQALLRQPMDFATRPEMHTNQYITGGRSFAFSCLPVEEHRRYRKLFVNALKSYALRKVKTDISQGISGNGPKSRSVVESIVAEEVAVLSRRLQEKNRDSADGLEMTEVYNETAWMTSNILCAFLFGESNDPGGASARFIIDSSDEFSKMRASTSIADMMPWVRYIVPGILSNFIKLARSQHEFIQSHIRKHLENFDKTYDWKNRDNEGIETTNVLDGLIETCRLNEGNPLYNDAHTLGIAADILLAGYDTVSKAQLWLFVYASVFQNSQTKMQEEIDAFIEEEERSPSYSDRDRFPYTNSFIHEVLRHSSFLPLTVPHSVTRDNVRLHGYDMPRGAIVFLNQWSVNRDENCWKKPEDFRPERFLDDEGRFKQDTGDQVLLFGMGVRLCPGKALANIELFLYLTEILRQCSFAMHPDNPGLPKSEFGLTMRPTSGKMIIKPR